MSTQIRSHPSRGTKISLFYIYMNRYIHIKVFSFVPKVYLTIIIGHMSDNISYYELLQHIRYKRKYNAKYSDSNRIVGGEYSNSVFCIRLSPKNIILTM